MSESPRIDPRILHGCNLSTPDGRRNAARLRTLTNAIVMWPHCPRRACRRARGCVDPHVRCFFLHHEAMREILYPMLREHAARRAAQEAERRTEDDAREGPRPA